MGQIKEVRWPEYVARKGGVEKNEKHSVKKAWSDSVMRCKHKWKNNIKVDHKELEYEDTDWIQLAKDRMKWGNLLNATVNFWVA